MLSKEATSSPHAHAAVWGLVSEFRLAAEVLGRGEFPAAEMVRHRFALEEINERLPDEARSTIPSLKVQIVF